MMVENETILATNRYEYAHGPVVNLSDAGVCLLTASKVRNIGGI